jgi:branched-chain amino acid transport system substrate-binding protein
MKKQGVKTVGFLGYTDAYGEQWLKDFTPLAEKSASRSWPPSASRAPTPA